MKPVADGLELDRSHPCQMSQADRVPALHHLGPTSMTATGEVPLAWRAGPSQRVPSNAGDPMPRMLLTIAALLLSCEAVPAQNAVSGLGSPTSGAPTGIPLGATEIDPGGLSPLPCSSLAGSSQSGAAAGTTFDGGGMFSSGCNAAPAATVSSTGNVSPLFTPGATSGSLLSGGSIPFGATEIDNGGVSPMITVPSPSLTLQTLGAISMTTVPTVSSASPSPCTGSPPSGGTSSGVTSGSTSTTGVTSSGC
jgi:hypothetical protein